MEFVRPRLAPAAVAAVAFGITLLASHGRSTMYNNYVLMAQGFLHGHLYVDAGVPGFIDTVTFNNQRYLAEAPLPALMMLPFIAMFGSVNQTLFADIFAALCVGGVFALGMRYGVATAANLWICAFALAGTDLLWCATLGDVWHLSHVTAFLFTILVLVEFAGKKRAWAIALLAAAAVLCRFNFLIAVPVYAAMLATPAAIGQFAAVGVPFVLGWIWYNFARWGLWYDIGYSLFMKQYHASQLSSPFSIRNVPYQLWSFFVQTPLVTKVQPWLVPTPSGVALTWTSPALLFSALARTPKALVVALWTLVVLTALPDLFYFSNGFAQFGMRHALDFEPYLIALMLLAAQNRKRIPVWVCALIVWSVLAGVWGCWYWVTFLRPLR